MAKLPNSTLNIHKSKVTSGIHIFQVCAKCGCDLAAGTEAIEIVDTVSSWYHLACFPLVYVVFTGSDRWFAGAFTTAELAQRYIDQIKPSMKRRAVWFEAIQLNPDITY